MHFLARSVITIMISRLILLLIFAFIYFALILRGSCHVQAGCYLKEMVGL